MRKSTLGVLLSLLLVAWPALAQDQRGSITGVVKDNTGAVLPGATVEARSAAGAVASTVTDANGVYRFPSLMPGTYEVTASLQGFTSAKLGEVPISLGQTKTVDLSLGVGGVSEKVQVSAEAPLIDVRGSGKSTNIRAEQIDLLPHNRDFTSLVSQAPGANFEPKSGNGFSIDGASGAENRFIVDGIETTQLVNGQSGKNVLADFVEEVQVKSTGYSAEFGGSTGGVINVITKSGTDRFSGSAVTYWQGSNSQASSNQTLRLKLSNANQAEYVTYPKDEYNRTEPGFGIGGPIKKSRAWFYGAYQPAIINTQRVVNTTTSNNPNAPSFDRTQKEQYQYLVANQTTQISDKLRTRVAFNNSWRKVDGQLPQLSGADAATTDFSKGSKYPNWSLSGTADYVVSPNFLVSARVGRYLQDQHDFNVPDVVRFTFANTNNIGMAGVPANLQHPTGYSNVPSNSAVTQDTQSRNFFQVDATYIFHAGGDHQVKGGVQVDRRAENIISGNQKNVVTPEWGQLYDASKPTGAFGYYHVTSNAVFPKQGFITQGDVHSNLTGLFVQDTWNLNNKLTVTVGVRTENENVPAFISGDTNFLGADPIKFGMADKIAPRAGASYDLNGDGRTKIYGSWGIFYDIFKLKLPQGSFGGDKWIEYYYTLDTPNYETLVDGANCPPACPGTFLDSQDLRLPSLNPGDVSNNLKPMRSQEASLGFERQLGPVMAFSARYVHKQLDRGIEDVGDIVEGGEHYIISNPGEGNTAKTAIINGASTYSPNGTITTPKAKRVYNAMEVALEKRLANNWFLRGSYTLSKDHGNYPGLAESDETTGTPRSDPNVGRLFDYPLMSFDGSGKPIDGVLPTDRTHQFKLAAIYQFKFGTTVGANQYLFSGTPITRAAAVLAGHNYPIFYLGRGSDGRTPAYAQTDLYVQHAIKVGGTRQLQFSMNVLNLFNQRAALDRWPNMRRAGTVLNFSEADYYAGKVNIQSLIDAGGFTGPDPRFLQDFRYQEQLQARFGVKFLF